jgi:hypothetical protein
MHDDRDDQVRALFHRIDDGPPLGIDVTDVMARGRRVRTQRTGLAAAGSVLAVAAAVVVSVNLGQADTPVRPAETPRHTTSTSSPSPMVPPPPSAAPSGDPSQVPAPGSDTSGGGGEPPPLPPGDSEGAPQGDSAGSNLPPGNSAG